LADACVDGNTVVGNRFIGFSPNPIDLDKATAHSRTDAFNASARKLSFVGHVKEPILETGGTQIGNEDFHCRSLT
jgi:hypothetical protein